jgi:molybdopterin-guanine dinucleotide biosynthesis protein A
VIPRSSVRGVVLAGGDSTRFDDGDKALADLHGRPLLGHVVDTVAEATTAPPLLAVSGAGEGDRLSAALERSPEPVVDVTDRAGPLAGLFAAVAAADRPWLFVCGCDMPLVSVEGIDALRAAGDPDDDAVVLTVDGHPQPLFGLYRRDAVSAVAGAVPETGGPMALLDVLAGPQYVPAASLDVPVERDATNVNTRAELAGLADRRDD